MATLVPTNTNLTSITWAHAVNSQKLLEEALADKIDFIEADIVLGTLENDPTGEKFPVMGHPPKNISDIKLETFLLRILDYNTDHPDTRKGVKLDFKSTEVYEGSLGILDSLWKKMNYPVWLNADIIPGPVNSTNLPVDPNIFLTASKSYPSAVLSIGWTTKWGSNYTAGSYTQNQIDDMVSVIKNNEITESKHEITFPVRAGIAAHSLAQLQYLVNALNKTNNVTLTIWSSGGDNVNIEKLRNLIFAFGVDKVYLDVPEEVANELDLGRSSSSSVWRSLFSFSMMNVVLYVITQLLTSFKG